MIVEETFYRPPELAAEARRLPAATYNEAVILVSRSQSGCVFVPIRAMQYLAVIDAEEFVFLHREGRRMIEIAWRHFQPAGREHLSQPVAYEAVYYTASARDTMSRLQGEFGRALAELAAKHRSRPQAPARVIKLDIERG